MASDGIHGNASLASLPGDEPTPPRQGKGSPSGKGVAPPLPNQGKGKASVPTLPGQGKGEGPPLPPGKGLGKGPPAPGKGGGKGPSAPSKASGKGASGAKAGSNTVFDYGSGPRLRSVFWQTTRQTASDNLWSKLDEQQPIPIKIDVLERYFAVQQAAPRRGRDGDTTSRNREESPSSKRIGGREYLQQKAAQDLGIQFKKLPKPAALETILTSLDKFPECLDQVALLKLNNAVEDHAEAIGQIRDAQETDERLNNEAERYLRVIGSVPHCQVKLACGALILSEAQEIEDVRQKADAVLTCCDKLRDSEYLHLSIHTCRHVGNILNRDAPRLQGHGAVALVLPDSLLKLEEHRFKYHDENDSSASATRPGNLLDFITQSIVDETRSSTTPDVLRKTFAELSLIVKEARKADLEVCESFCKTTCKKARDQRDRLQALEQSDGGKRLRERIDNIVGQADLASSRQQRAKEELAKTRAFFTHNSKASDEEWMTGWITFLDQLSAAFGRAVLREQSKEPPSASRGKKTWTSPTNPQVSQVAPDATVAHTTNVPQAVAHGAPTARAAAAKAPPVCTVVGTPRAGTPRDLDEAFKGVAGSGTQSAQSLPPQPDRPPVQSVRSQPVLAAAQEPLASPATAPSLTRAAESFSLATPKGLSGSCLAKTVSYDVAALMTPNVQSGATPDPSPWRNFPAGDACGGSAAGTVPTPSRVRAHRPSCKLGRGCLSRNDAQHAATHAHPGDPDYEAPQQVNPTLLNLQAITKASVEERRRRNSDVSDWGSPPNSAPSSPRATSCAVSAPGSHAPTRWCSPRASSCAGTALDTHAPPAWQPAEMRTVSMGSEMQRSRRRAIVPGSDRRPSPSPNSPGSDRSRSPPDSPRSKYGTPDLTPRLAIGGVQHFDLSPERLDIDDAALAAPSYMGVQLTPVSSSAAQEDEAVFYEPEYSGPIPSPCLATPTGPPPARSVVASWR